ncbi:MAG: cysteine--tRNA ligase [Alphaproteobacteria bacterium]|nr:cysteine--tRNA ligase [Alphaproteobacteria bacterium]OJV47315.1 MAG: cysteine--tRNA ligase [Alphaproteobacteria bacterium 43-37]
MTLYFYNSLSRRKELFIPQDESCIKLYVCGPTVYDRAHLGNARSAVVFDQLFRLLRIYYPAVHYARNITDVDDKINEASLTRGLPIEAITQETTAWYQQDMTRLNALPPTVEPRATAHISEMIDMIQTLIVKGHAYEAEGHVLFRVVSFPEYGKLSGRSQDDVLAGARVEVAPFKEDPSDFVLWKPSESPMPGWESPWGFGRPGWHIECSAMGQKHLGFPLDIHCGGHDLQFPHHENEIAQGECATGKTCARYWLHNGMLTVDGQKMSKSLGNFITMEEAFSMAPGEVIRYVLLSGHYRQDLDWNESHILQARQAMDRFYQVKGLAEAQGVSFDIEPEADIEVNPVLEALEDDLNTPKAFAILHQLANSLYKDFSIPVFLQFYQGAQTLGLLSMSSGEWFQGSLDETGLCMADVEQAILDRAQAKCDKDYGQADRIRLDLLEKGIVLEDHKDGTTTWKKS